MKVNQLIKKLISNTDTGEIKWFKLNSLDENKKLEQYIKDNFNILPAQVSNNLNIDIPNSYYTKYKDGYFYLMNKEKKFIIETRNYFILAVQNDNETRIMDLNSEDDHQADLYRLFNLIERQILNIDKFIEDFIDDDNNYF